LFQEIEGQHVEIDAGKSVEFLRPHIPVALISTAPFKPFEPAKPKSPDALERPPSPPRRRPERKCKGEIDLELEQRYHLFNDGNILI
jgi:hypothetical protein